MTRAHRPYRWVKRSVAPSHCVECGRPLRTSQTLAERPGTIRHASGGRCITCHGTRAGSNIRYRFKLSRTDWAAMLIAQSGRCAVCKIPMRAPCVDHDHATGEVRGLLCSHCNSAEGLLGRDIVRVRALADYMERYQ